MKVSLSTLHIIWLYPDLLSTYGDRGNLLALAHRARARGIDVEPMQVRSDQHIPHTADLYLLGGGEDGPQAVAAERLLDDGAVGRAADAGKPILAVCAGYQLLGESFYANGRCYPGLNILDLRSDRAPFRAVGEIAGESSSQLDIGPITGFENHGGRTHLGEAVQPLARVTAGVGNDGTTEGAWAGHVVGSYMHGPALVRNPKLADLMLAWALGVDSASLQPIDDTWLEHLRQERFTALTAAQ